MRAVLQLKCNPKAGLGVAGVTDLLDQVAAGKRQKVPGEQHDQGGGDEDAEDGASSPAEAKDDNEVHGNFRKMSPEVLAHLLDLTERGFPTETEIQAVRDYLRQNELQTSMTTINTENVMDDKEVSTRAIRTTNSGNNRDQDRGQVAQGEDHFKEVLLGAPESIRTLAVKMAFGAVRTNSIREEQNVLLFPLLSRVNHGCRPNVWQQHGVMLALRDIEPGEELFWCYPQGKVLDEWDDDTAQHFLFLGTKERREYLKRFYDFECRCGRCCKHDEEKTATKASKSAPYADASAVEHHDQVARDAAQEQERLSLRAKKQELTESEKQENEALLTLRLAFTLLTRFINKISPAEKENDLSPSPRSSAAEEIKDEEDQLNENGETVGEQQQQEQKYDYDEDEAELWHRHMENCDLLLTELAEADLDVDLRLLARISTLRALYDSTRLMSTSMVFNTASSTIMHHDPSSVDLTRSFAVQRDFEKALTQAIEGVQSEVKYHLLGYGPGVNMRNKAVEDLTRVLGELYYLQNLKQYLRRIAGSAATFNQSVCGGA
ncbi:unnamed protein product [Amoebophrya sp. A25]|nr:unnamed protein product [Amoebophrya sp. A25]|eukprot:GSA25T00012141001.1